MTWYTYFGPGYKYTAIDGTGRKPLTWTYLNEINAQVATLAPVMSRLTSTGVFFNAPTPGNNLPLLPGGLVEAVACPAPLMVGEFRESDGRNHVMLVNLSLERSAKFTVKMRQPYDSIQVASAIDGSFSPFDQKEGLWLVAGQGVLLTLGN